MSTCLNSGYKNKVLPIIQTLNIEENKRKILLARFVEEVVLYDKKARVTEAFYMTFNLIITIGSVVLPALLSIQNVNFSDDEEVDEGYRDKIYWLSWSISLLISICNGLIQLLSLNKQYSSYILVREKLIAEGWKYFELCDEYKGKDHKFYFTKFCEEIENIKKSQTEREIVFLNPKPNNPNTGTGEPPDGETDDSPEETDATDVPPPRFRAPAPPTTEPPVTENIGRRTLPVVPDTTIDETNLDDLGTSITVRNI